MYVYIIHIYKNLRNKKHFFVNHANPPGCCEDIVYLICVEQSVYFAQDPRS